jgi:hypothetical protein
MIYVLLPVKHDGTFAAEQGVDVKTFDVARRMAHMLMSDDESIAHVDIQSHRGNLVKRIHRKQEPLFTEGDDIMPATTEHSDLREQVFPNHPDRAIVPISIATALASAKVRENIRAEVLEVRRSSDPQEFVVLWHDADRKLENGQFGTHALFVFPEGANLTWGHYDMDYARALADFETRVPTRYRG